MKSVQRTAIGFMGIVATVLLHVLLFAVAMWSDEPYKVARLPDVTGAGANYGQNDGNTSERMIIIRLSLEVRAADLRPETTPQLTEPSQELPMMEVTGPDIILPPPLVFEEEGELTETSHADIIARTKMTGLYEGQIRARIERVWAQPAKSAGTPPYKCRAKISQQQDGRIRDVTLEDCEGSLEWLDSLVDAIKGASPLPGAPHPSVFVDSFSLVFRAD